jgi:hypothetical protein
VLKRLAVFASVLLVLVIASPGVAQAQIHVLGDRCIGDKVLRCLRFHWDDANDRLRAYGVAIDVGDGINYQVAINQLRLQILTPSGTWSDIGMPGTINTSWNLDYDDYHEDADTADGSLFSCGGLDDFITVRAYAHFAWKGASTGSGNAASDPHENVPCF